MANVYLLHSSILVYTGTYYFSHTHSFSWIAQPDSTLLSTTWQLGFKKKVKGQRKNVSLGQCCANGNWFQDSDCDVSQSTPHTPMKAQPVATAPPAQTTVYSIMQAASQLLLLLFTTGVSVYHYTIYFMSKTFNFYVNV